MKNWRPAQMEQYFIVDRSNTIQIRVNLFHDIMIADILSSKGGIFRSRQEAEAFLNLIGEEQETMEYNEELILVQCCCCGDEVEEQETTTDRDGDIYCETCAGDYLTECADCGEMVNYSDSEMFTIRESGYRHRTYEVCNNCIDDYSTCADCGEWVHDDNLSSTAHGDCICEDCRCDNYYYCEDCGELYHNDYINFDDDTGVCDNCFNRSRGRVHSYSYRPNPKFIAGDLIEYDYSTMRGEFIAGVELEADTREGESADFEAIEYIHTKAGEYVYLKSDGSLNNGFEVVSHPMTIEAHKKIWNGITTILRNAEFKSHNTSTCGLHIHIDRYYFGDNRQEQELNIAKMLYIFSKFWESDIVPFSRRNIERISQWAGKPAMELERGEQEHSINNKLTNHYCKGRYTAINLENRATVEFRIFRGTLKADTIIASMQWVKLLIDCCKATSIDDLINMRYSEIIAGREHYLELTKYMNERGI